MTNGEKMVWAAVYNYWIQHNRENHGPSLGMTAQEEIDREIVEHRDAAERAGYAVRAMRKAYETFEDYGYGEDIEGMFRSIVRGRR